MDIKNILFPTNFSDSSKKAGEYVLYLAKNLDSTVHIVHIIEPLRYLEIDEEIIKFYDDLKNKLNPKMENKLSEFHKENINTKSEIIIGARWKEINIYAEDNDIDLIIMGSHGLRDHKGDISIGTTSHKVIFTCTCPIMLIKNEQN